MKITVLGATGMVGRRVTTEALGRGHRLVAVARTPPRAAPGLTPLAVDVADPAAPGAAMAGADVAVLAVRRAPGAEATLSALTRSVLDAAQRTGTRVLVVGGAGPLRCPADPDRLLVDDPTYVPEQWRTLAAASVAQLRECQAHPGADWTYLSPPAVLEPGERTGRYRRGTDTALADRAGVSRVSAEDLAVAVLDELERPGADRWFTVADC